MGSLFYAYKKFALKQRIQELEKAIRRNPSDDELYMKRKTELEALNAELDSIIDKT